MSLKKTYAALTSGFLWSALMISASAHAQKVGEQSDSSPNVLALCNCNTPDSCKALLASQSSESQRSAQPGQHGGGVSDTLRQMLPQGR
jgi:hypothetical protein